MDDKLTLYYESDRMTLTGSQEDWTLKRDKGYSPVQSLVAAAAACGAYVYQEVLENSKVAFEFEKVIASYTRVTEDRVGPIDSISLTFYLKVTEDQQDKAIRCLKLVSRNCPVIQSLDPKIKVIETAEFI